MAQLITRAVFGFLATTLIGCTSIGPSTVPRDRVDYSNALSAFWKDQMLLNIVRLRYADTPTFMDVSSVISAYTIQTTLQAGETVNIGFPNNTTTLPNGEEVAQSLLTPDSAKRHFFLDCGGLSHGLSSFL